MKCIWLIEQHMKHLYQVLYLPYLMIIYLFLVKSLYDHLKLLLYPMDRHEYLSEEI